MAKNSSFSWTADDLTRLTQLSAAGASVMRAAAALGRRSESVKKMARQHNLPLVGTRQAKAMVRELDRLSADK